MAMIELSTARALSGWAMGSAHASYSFTTAIVLNRVSAIGRGV